MLLAYSEAIEFFGRSLSPGLRREPKENVVNSESSAHLAYISNKSRVSDNAWLLSAITVPLVMRHFSL
jgi:hypothetical protein